MDLPSFEPVNVMSPLDINEILPVGELFADTDTTNDYNKADEPSTPTYHGNLMVVQETLGEANARPIGTIKEVDFRRGPLYADEESLSSQDTYSLSEDEDPRSDGYDTPEEVEELWEYVNVHRRELEKLYSIVHHYSKKKGLSVFARGNSYDKNYCIYKFQKFMYKIMYGVPRLSPTIRKRTTPRPTLRKLMGWNVDRRDIDSLHSRTPCRTTIIVQQPPKN